MLDMPESISLSSSVYQVRAFPVSRGKFLLAEKKFPAPISREFRYKLRNSLAEFHVRPEGSAEIGKIPCRIPC
jgi:hypothetical protein